MVNHRVGCNPSGLDKVTPRWLRYLAIALIVLGVGLRCYQIDRKVYWQDEVFTSLRVSGYIKSEVVATLYDRPPVSVAILQRYQQPPPEHGWNETLKALEGKAEHAPLYFLMARQWMHWFGSSIAAMRSLPVLLSLLALPCVFWFIWELFGSAIVAWCATALFAITPLYVLYAQEARPYSLWILLTFVSSTMLLRALRSPQWGNWLLYGITVAIGLYGHLLFAWVAIAHGLYVALTETQAFTGKCRRMTIGYLLAVLGGLVAFLPWLALVITNFEKIHKSSDAFEEFQFNELIKSTLLNTSRALFDHDLGLGNLGAIALGGYALYYLVRHTDRRVWLFVLMLVIVPFLALALPYVFSGLGRNLHVRYLFPCAIGLQIAIIYALLAHATAANHWQRWIGRSVIVAIVANSLAVCLVSSQSQFWWSKGSQKNIYFQPVAAQINQALNPLVISGDRIEHILALSNWLQPHVQFQLITQPKTVQPAAGFQSIFLLNPSAELRTALKRQNYRLKRLYRDPTASRRSRDRLWSATPRNPAISNPSIHSAALSTTFPVKF